MGAVHMVNAQLKSLDPLDIKGDRGGFWDGLCAICGKLRHRLPPRNSVCGLEGGLEFALLDRREALEMRKLQALSVVGAGLALAFGPFGTGAANAQSPPQSLTAYPTKSITAVVPFAAGSASDVVSRILFAQMSKSMGQTIVVENRPGAGGNNGTADVAKQAPDGYTLVGSGSGPMAANVTLYKQLGYDPQKDFEVISPFAKFTIVVAASNKLPVNTLQELIDYGKKNPGLNYGSVGIGSSQHLAGEYFSQLTGMKMTHVPYKNIGQYVPDMIAGDVPLGFQWYPNVAAALNAKGAKALAVAGTNRLDILPDTPTVKEAGLPDYLVSGWFALSVPKGTPAPIVDKLNDEVKKALADPDVRAKFQQQGAETYYLSPAESKKFITDEIGKYHDIITKAGIAQIE
jgi:tripartite-type tricarboxylate transporter receptor subunit TctC